MNGMRRVAAGGAGSVIGRSRRRGDVITTAVRSVETRRAHRDRTVYVGESRQDRPIHDASATSPTHHRRGRLGALSRHEPYSPLAGTVLRPLGDAATTLAILLRRR